jgi:hypothetical protein
LILAAKQEYFTTQKLHTRKSYGNKKWLIATKIHSKKTTEQ